MGSIANRQRQWRQLPEEVKTKLNQRAQSGWKPRRARIERVQGGWRVSDRNGYWRRVDGAREAEELAQWLEEAGNNILMMAGWHSSKWHDPL